ncbi:glutaredoxin family protein [Lysinibacillus sp. SGAir0095]|uniref:glutaredoxin family protein n=1 Tax=Lysinibacillus sp. SGAir0095 TaxID=2070463 RepID=UPI0010CD1B19|nr:glutaredoxin family protein [Lysinibacillus sp. SGAir0095]QCR34533.1 thiol-disulfide isomerase [Lysinibacillus sp. SGAir0095]
MKVNFYTRPGCPLCEEGLLTLKLLHSDVQFEIDIINIEENEALHEKYMLMIPVVEVKGEIIQYGNLDYVTLYEALQA